MSRKKLKSSYLNNNYFRDQLRDFKPNFDISSLESNNSFPLLPLLMAYDKKLIIEEFELFRNNLIFLINFFSGALVEYNLTANYNQLRFLMAYLSYVGIANLSEKDLNTFDGTTYFDLKCFVCKFFSLSEFDISTHKEQVIVEYLAFKR